MLNPVSHFFARKRVVTRALMFVRVETGQHGRQRGAAKGGGDVSAAQHQTLRCQLVQPRSLNDVMAHEAVIPETLIVTDQNHYIGAGDILALRKTSSGARNAQTE